MRRTIILLSMLLLAVGSNDLQADLLGYWSVDSSGGTGTTLPNDQGNSDLDGEIFGATFTADGEGHTGMPGDFAVSFPGEDDDYVVIPPTEETFEEITITAWVSGLQVGAWAGLVISRDGSQPIGLDFHAFDGTTTYIWNNNAAETWSFISDLVVPEDEWTFVALTVDPDKATLYAGPAGGVLEFATNEIPHIPQDNFSEWRWAEDDCCGGQRNFSGLMDDVSIWNDALSFEELQALHSGTATPLTLRAGGQKGDFNGNGVLDAGDIDELSTAVRAMSTNTKYDLTGDGLVNDDDRKFWISDESVAHTWVGDANLDGEFGSMDFVDAFLAGKYETGESIGWAGGDWNGDGLFSSQDFVASFLDGGYELGQRPAVAAVPEPSAVLLLMLGSVLTFAKRRRGH